VLEAGDSSPRSGVAMITRATASVGKRRGSARVGASTKAAPCRAAALRARRADAWRPSPLPLGRWWSAVTRRPPPASRVTQRLTVAGPANAAGIGPVRPAHRKDATPTDEERDGSPVPQSVPDRSAHPDL